jgi:Na+/H+ antiporter
MQATLAVLGLITLAVAVSALAHRLSAPAPSLLVLAGLVLALLPGVPEVTLSPEVVSFAVLPPLLFAGAQGLPARELRAVARPILLLAFGLVGVTAAAVAYLLHAIEPQVALSTGFVLGAVLSSTDPVAVAALARRLHLPRRLHVLVQGESLFNDATSLVLFRVAVGVVVAGGSADLLRSAWDFLRVGVGGAVLGLVIAGLVRFLRSRTEDSEIETTLALVAPYATYLAAESAHLSGVTAVVVLGVALAGSARQEQGAAIRLQIATAYDIVVFLLESTIFAVIGLQLPSLYDHLPAGERNVTLTVVALVTTVLAVRALVVFPAGLARDSSAWRPAAVATWAGARGVVPLAAALSIPLTVNGGGDFPQRDLLLFLTSCTVVTTLVVQGLTLAPLVRRLGVRADEQEEQRQETVARHRLAIAAQRHLEHLSAEVDVAPAVLDRLRSAVAERVDRSRLRLEHPDAERTGLAYQAVRRRLLQAERAELAALHDAGRVSEPVRRRIERTLDLEEAALGD